MAITLSVFLYAYFGFLVLWLIFSLVAIFHLLKFGFKGPATFITAFGYIAVSSLALLVTYNLVSNVDWQTSLTVFGNIITIN